MNPWKIIWFSRLLSRVTVKRASQWRILRQEDNILLCLMWFSVRKSLKVNWTLDFTGIQRGAKVKMSFLTYTIFSRLMKYRWNREEVLWFMVLWQNFISNETIQSQGIKSHKSSNVCLETLTSQRIFRVRSLIRPTFCRCRGMFESLLEYTNQKSNKSERQTSLSKFWMSMHWESEMRIKWATNTTRLKRNTYQYSQKSIRQLLLCIWLSYILRWKSLISLRKCFKPLKATWNTSRTMGSWSSISRPKIMWHSGSWDVENLKKPIKSSKHSKPKLQPTTITNLKEFH